MPKIVDATAQRLEIREAARQVFARRGVRGTGLTHVAEAAGMGRSSLYHYYPDKDALLRDLVRHTLDQERALFRACLRGEGPPLKRIERLMGSCVDLFPEWAAFGRMLLDLRVADARLFRNFFREARGELADVIREGQRSGAVRTGFEPQLMAATLIGMIDGLLFQHFADPRALGDPKRVAAALCDDTRRLLEP